MTGPKRIQRQRTKGWRMPKGAVYVGRPTEWGNPWRVGERVMTETPTGDGDGTLRRQSLDITPAPAVALYRVAFAPDFPEAVDKLGGRDLACWCPLDQPCHADVLLELANPATTAHGARTAYGACTACGAVQVALVRATGTRDLSWMGESDSYPTGYGCEVCA